jgi:hypothetical protein
MVLIATRRVRACIGRYTSPWPAPAPDLEAAQTDRLCLAQHALEMGLGVDAGLASESCRGAAGVSI